MSAGSRHGSDQLRIEASIVARLLGIRLLVIDASVIVAPVQANGRAAGHLADGMFTPRVIGAGLAGAERFLGEAEASLAAARASASRARTRR